MSSVKSIATTRAERTLNASSHATSETVRLRGGSTDQGPDSNPRVVEGRVVLAVVDGAAPLTIYLAEIDRGAVALVGGKGANLGELARAGFPVPNGFVLTTRAYALAAEAAGVDPARPAEAAENLDQADALLFGRVTYEMMQEAWRQPAPAGARHDWMEPFARKIDAAKKYVVSSTLDRVGWNAELLRGDLGKAVQQLKREPGEGLFVGGVELPLALAELGLTSSWCSSGSSAKGRLCSRGYRGTST